MRAGSFVPSPGWHGEGTGPAWSRTLRQKGAYLLTASALGCVWAITLAIEAFIAATP